MYKIFHSAALLLLVLVTTVSAHAGDVPEFTTVIKDHKFSPDVIEVPANTKFLLIVENKDATPEEFESHDLKREKIIAGGATGRFKMGPLKPGEYGFFGEFNEATAQGKIIVKE